jgi:hypothetical protein
LNASAWNLSFLPNRIRTFIFKFYNNLLGINVRTAHFAANPDRTCFFCSNTGAPPDETFTHLFRDCPSTANWHARFAAEFFNLQGQNQHELSLFWFFGRYAPEPYDINILIFLGVIIFQYCIWEEKLRKRRPSYLTIKTYFLDIFVPIVKGNRKLINNCQRFNLPLCRSVCPLQ